MENSVYQTIQFTKLSSTNSEKSEGVVLKNLPKGGPKGNQTLPRGAAPR